MFTQPNFFFIGGMRCGSTSLNLMLEQHPEIYMSPIKEPNYYIVEAFQSKDQLSTEHAEFLARYQKSGKYRTPEAYQSLFRDVGKAKVVGESSHYLYHSDCAEVIFRDSSDARILICLRNPVDRLFSEYLLLLREGSETKSFKEYIDRHVVSFVNGEISDKREVRKLAKGLQANLLKPWLDQFGRRQVKLILFDDLNDYPAETMKEIFSWLGVDDSVKVKKIHAQKGGALKAKWLSNTLNSQNGVSQKIKSVLPKAVKVQLRSLVFSRTLERPSMDPRTRDFLSEFYREDVEELSSLCGKDLSGWTAI